MNSEVNKHTHYAYLQMGDYITTHMALMLQCVS